MTHHNYTEQAERALKLARQFVVESHHSYIGTEHILVGLLREWEGTAGRLLADFGVTEEKLVKLIDELIAPGDTLDRKSLRMSPRAQVVLEQAEADAASSGVKTGTEQILLSMLRENGCVAARLLHTLGVNVQKLYASILTAMGYDNEAINEEFHALRFSQGSKMSLTPMLDQYSRDLTAVAAEGKLDPVIGREKEISRLIQTLSRRTKNNPCLVGEPGVGKTAIVEGLSQRITAGQVPQNMLGKRVVVLDLSGMVAGSKYRGEFEERIRGVIDEVTANKNILLFVDELHTIIGAGSAEGTLDASNILKPALSRGAIQLIGATTLEEYRRYIEKDAALERRFQPITVEEPTEEESVDILTGLRSYYEKHHNVVIEDSAVTAAVRMAARYISDRFLPDKAIDVIDEACAKVRLAGYKKTGNTDQTEQELLKLQQQKEEAVRNADLEAIRMIQEKQNALLKKKNRSTKAGKLPRVTEETVADIISEWTKIPANRLTESETRRLSRLEAVLKKRVIGQDEAVHAVSQAVKRGRVGLKDPARPIGSFLFLGPTGVGKTELSKALAEAVFGTEQAMIRLDMSEYMEKHTVSRLIGSPPGYVGYEEGGQLSEKVRRHPYSVILFDEIEKAHPDVFNILLQVLDDGHITDAHGRKVDFKQTIIIMTSNAGAQSIMEPKKLGFVSGNTDAADYERMKSGVMEEVRRLFRPEFLNRIDEIMVFHPLGKEEIRKIVGILLSNLEKRCKEQLDLTLIVSSQARDHIAKAGMDQKYGARPLKRSIQSQLEDALATELLEGRVHAGDRVRVSLQKERLVFRTEKPDEKTAGK